MPEGTCFVVMGFGKKTDFETGRTLDLDKSYQNMIKPAVEAAGLTCIRADEIVHSGLIDVPMYEQLFTADVVVADLSTSNKNAFYELGVRHALKPYTTIVIAEDGVKTFPFDVNHVAIRQYHHLGEDIGYSEVERFRKLLTKAIVDILEKDPRDRDSPVYTFLNKLNPPGLGDAVRTAVQEAASSATAPTISQPAAPAAVNPLAAIGAGTTHSILMQQVEEAQERNDFVTAKALLSTVRFLMQSPDQPENPYIIQQLALLTYKSQLPTPEQSLREALNLLSILEPHTSNDTETLGLWGAINKRLFDVTADPVYLSQAIRAYRRGFYLRNDYYNGINVAYLFNLRSSKSASRADAIADFVEAQRIRKQVVTICDQWLADNPEPAGLRPASREAVKAYRKSKYWVLATLAEAYIGIGEDAKGQQTLEEADALKTEGWMRDSTREQIGKLNVLLADSPLKYVRTD